MAFEGASCRFRAAQKLLLVNYCPHGTKFDLGWTRTNDYTLILGSSTISELLGRVNPRCVASRRRITQRTKTVVIRGMAGVTGFEPVNTWVKATCLNRLATPQYKYGSWNCAILQYFQPISFWMPTLFKERFRIYTQSRFLHFLRATTHSLPN